jgi:type I restriction enzyme S subunit
MTAIAGADEARTVNTWRDVALGDLVETAGGVIRTGPFGSQLHAHEYTDDPFGVPVVMPKDMIGGRVNRRSVSRVSEEVADRLSTHRLAPGDLVLARRGDVGRFAYIEQDEAGWLCGTGSMRVHAPDRRVVWPRYLHYALANPAVTEWLVGRAVGATMPNLNDGIVAAIPLRVPDLPSQRRIAAVLGAFDELIEVNERRIELLEDLARSLYREWFVRFRFPGHEDAPPCSLPAGWERSTLGAMANWFSGGTPSTKNPDYWDGGIPWITSGSLTSLLLTASERTLTPAGVAARSRLVERDTLLFVVRGMSLVREFRVGIADRTLAFGQDCKALAAIDGVHPMYLAFSVLDRQHDIQRMVELAGHGTGKLSTDRLKAIEIALPPQPIQLQFADVVAPMRELLSTAARSAERLGAARDLLLPRLVTGRLDTSDIDLDALLTDAEDV